jgi:L-methionine (R)-S-oxide reductase
MRGPQVAARRAAGAGTGSRHGTDAARRRAGPAGLPASGARPLPPAGAKPPRSAAPAPHRRRAGRITNGSNGDTSHMTPELASSLGAAIAAEVEAASSPEGALDAAVRRLAASVPAYTWVGIYLLEGRELVLGPFVGKPSPHTRIPLDRGICGAAASSGRTIIVDDVGADPRYLACSLETRSEIVVPIKAGDRVLGEIDIDSDQPAAFGDLDRRLLEGIAEALARRLAGQAAS